jgi:hypothetical protein
LSKNGKNSTCIICPKFIGQPKNLKLENIFQASWKIFSQEFFRIPNFLGAEWDKKNPKLPKFFA